MANGTTPSHLALTFNISDLVQAETLGQAVNELEAAKAHLVEVAMASLQGLQIRDAQGKFFSPKLALDMMNRRVNNAERTVRFFSK
jgi:hypothetical protein